MKKKRLLIICLFFIGVFIGGFFLFYQKKKKKNERWRKSVIESIDRIQKNNEKERNAMERIKKKMQDLQWKR